MEVDRNGLMCLGSVVCKAREVKPEDQTQLHFYWKAEVTL